MALTTTFSDAPQSDTRDVLLSLPLPYHSAEYIGIDPGRAYFLAAPLLRDPAAKIIGYFPLRDKENRDLAAFAWKAVEEHGGLSYQRIW